MAEKNYNLLKTVEYFKRNAISNSKKTGSKPETPFSLKCENIRSITVEKTYEKVIVKIAYYENPQRYFSIDAPLEEHKMWNEISEEIEIGGKPKPKSILEALSMDNTADDIKVGLQVIDGVLYDNGRKQF